MKKAFTLVELLVVIGIIAVLAGIMMVSMGGGSEAARAAQCLTNMRGLANAAVTYAASSSYYPLAGSVTWSKIDESQGIGKGKTVYYEMTGWLSWYSQNQFPSGSYQAPEYPSAYASGSTVSSAEQQQRDFAISNGTLRASLAGSRDLLLCPDHKLQLKANAPFFSYVMNEYFKWNDTGKARSEQFRGRSANEKYADRRLLFAEINWKGYAGEPNLSPGNEGTDQVLQYSKGEYIGFNHKKGKEKVAHVAFADGHTEQLLLPKGGMDESALKELTKLLCEGKDVAFNGSQYEEMK